MSVSNVRAYAVSSTWFPSHEEIVIAPNAGNAKYRKWLDIRDVCEECPITSMRARSVAGYHESSRFRRVAEYRGIPWAKVGMRVTAEGLDGVIVDGNGSCNLNVLVGRVVYNVHPLFDVTYYADDGSVLARVKHGKWEVRPDAALSVERHVSA